MSGNMTPTSELEEKLARVLTGVDGGKLHADLEVLRKNQAPSSPLLPAIVQLLKTTLLCPLHRCFC